MAALLGIAALTQAFSGTDSSTLPHSASTTTSLTKDTAGGAVSISPSTSSVSAPTSTSPPAPTSSIDYPVSVSDDAQGVLRVSGYGPKEFRVNRDLALYRTIIYRNEDNTSGLTIELHDSEDVPLLVLGHAQSPWSIQGVRDVREQVQDVVTIAVDASNGWIIEFLPEAFLWDKEIRQGNTPKAGDFSVLSSDGITFVGTDTDNDQASGLGDLLIYNACQGCSQVPSTVWTLRFDPRCDDTPKALIKKIGEAFFQREIRPLKSDSGGQELQVTLEESDWLQILTSCEWSAAPRTA